MRATLRRYRYAVLLLILLPFPLDPAPIQVIAPAPAAPFLPRMSAQLRATRMLTAVSSTMTFAHNVLSPTATAAEALPSPKTVVVLKGQSLWEIAVANDVAVDQLVRTNALRNAALIQPGHTLVLPAPAAPSPAQRLEAPRPQNISPAQTPPAQTAARKPLVVTVQNGQSLWVLAQQYGTTVDAIVAANDLRSPKMVRVGQRLLVPAKGAAASRRPAAARTVSAGRTTTVVVQDGQTLWSLARAHGVSVDTIVAANGLRSAEYIRAGQRLVIPSRATVLPPARRVAAAAVSGGRSNITPLPVAGVVQGFIWPARGVITSRFGWRWRRHHDGIDIAAPRGSAITAARAGRVSFAGWYYGYGRAVIIDHGNGLQTVYGHATVLLVQAGQTVQAGQLIARVGSTGSATGPHLHFEVRIYGRAVNPLKYL